LWNAGFDAAVVPDIVFAGHTVSDIILGVSTVPDSPAVAGLCDGRGR
jgi:hypothetical protein